MTSLELYSSFYNSLLIFGWKVMILDEVMAGFGRTGALLGYVLTLLVGQQCGRQDVWVPVL